MITRKNLLAVAVSTSLAATMVACSGTNDVAKDGASAKTEVSSHAKEGKCGEGKCGDDKAGKEGKCGEGKCGGDKSKKEGKCGEGKCGEGKCGSK